MTAAWFQLITSENGNSHPLLSITGTQAAWGKKGLHECKAGGRGSLSNGRSHQDELNYGHFLLGSLHGSWAAQQKSKLG